MLLGDEVDDSTADADADAAAVVVVVVVGGGGGDRFVAAGVVNVKLRWYIVYCR